VTRLVVSLMCFSALMLKPAQGPTHAPPKPAPHDVSIVLGDSSIQAPAQFEAGHIILKVTNTSHVYHQVALMRVAQGHSAITDLHSLRDTGRMPNGLVASGGLGPLPPGSSASVLIRVPPGEYLLLCTMNGPKGDPWFRHGMASTIAATGVGESRLAYEDASSGLLVSEARFRFGNTTHQGDRLVLFEGRNRLTEVIRGPQSIQIENAGAVAHAVVLVRSETPEVMRAYVAWQDGRGPAPDIVGGIPALPVGGAREYLRVNLPQGSYVIFCPQFHARTGLRGYETGEFSQFVAR
jgi:hypothetical protein